MARPAGFSESEDENFYELEKSSTHFNDSLSNTVQNGHFQNPEIRLIEKKAFPSNGHQLVESTACGSNGLLGTSLQQNCSHLAALYESLQVGCVEGDVSLVKEALNQGVDVDQVLAGGWTPLMFACSRGRAAVVRLLLQSGADPNFHHDLFTPLMAACASTRGAEPESSECVEALLAGGASVGAAERHRVTPLMFAAKEGRAALVRRLIQAGAPVDARDNKGWTALCWAASKGRGLACQSLISGSADAAAATEQGQTAADIARSEGYAQLSDVLGRVVSGNANREEVCWDGGEDRALPESTGILTKRFSEMEMVLTGLDLSHLSPLFKQHQITLEIFLQLNDSDLEKMGVSELGSRKKLTSTILQIHKYKWKTSSLPNLATQPHITFADSVALLRNVNKHLRYIRASLGYLKDQVRANPSILELDRGCRDVGDLLEVLADCGKDSSLLTRECALFESSLGQIMEKESGVRVAGEITEDRVKSVSRRRSQCLMVLLLVAIPLASVCYLRQPATPPLKGLTL